MQQNDAQIRAIDKALAELKATLKTYDEASKLPGAPLADLVKGRAIISGQIQRLEAEKRRLQFIGGPPIPKPDPNERGVGIFSWDRPPGFTVTSGTIYINDMGRPPVGRQGFDFEIVGNKPIPVTHLGTAYQYDPLRPSNFPPLGDFWQHVTVRLERIDNRFLGGVEKSTILIESVAPDLPDCEGVGGCFFWPTNRKVDLRPRVRYRLTQEIPNTNRLLLVYTGKLLPSIINTKARFVNAILAETLAGDWIRFVKPVSINYLDASLLDPIDKWTSAWCSSWIVPEQYRERPNTFSNLACVAGPALASGLKLPQKLIRLLTGEVFRDYTKR